MITRIVQSEVGNLLLGAIKPGGFGLLLPDLEPVPMPARFKLSDANLPSDWVYFPVSGVAAVIGNFKGTWQEAGLFGRDGAGCLTVLMGSRLAPNTISMVLPGAGFRIGAAHLQSAFKTNSDVQDILLRYVRVSHVKLIQTALANTQLNIEQRLARFLLMVVDRIGEGTVRLTHENLSTMFGIGRTAVTLALQALERQRLIVTARSQIIVMDRMGLEDRSTPLYGYAEAEYERLIYRFRGR